MNVVLYTTHCPKCEVLAQKLTLKNVKYTVCDDIDKVIATGERIGIMSAPFLKIEDEYMDFSKAVKWLNEEVPNGGCSTCDF